MFAGLDLSDLRLFVEVVDARGFRNAAANLYLSQPSISRAVARLEKSLGVTLMDRKPSGAVVTVHGAALAAGARGLLAAAAELRAEVVGLDQMNVTLGAAASNATRFLSSFLGTWIPSHPEVQIVAMEGDDKDLLERVVGGKCDLAIVSAPVPRTVESLRIATIDVVAVLPADHPLARSGIPLGVADLLAEPLIVNYQGFPSRDLLDHAFASSGVAPRIVYECSSGGTLVSLAASGLGIAVFGRNIELSSERVVGRTIVGASGAPLTYDLYVVWSKNPGRPWIREFALDVAASGRDSARGM